MFIGLSSYLLTSTNQERSTPFSLLAPLISSLQLSVGVGTFNFSRATTASVLDFEGNLRTAIANEARFVGARRVQNRVPENPATWGSNITATITSGITDPMGGNTAYRFTAAGPNSRIAHPVELNVSSGTSSIWVRRVSGTGIVSMFVLSAYTPVNITPQWQRISLTQAGRSTTLYLSLLLATSGDTVDVWHGQAENTTGQSNTAPSEYVPSTWNDTGAPGVRYFTTLNGNTVDANGVVTEAVGAAIPDATLKGFLSEPSATNIYLNSATANTQNVTVAAKAYTLALDGAGSIVLSGAATGTLTGVAGQRTSLTVTCTAGTLTLTGTTGSNVQLEVGVVPTSYIKTTTSAVTRGGDTLWMASAGALKVLSPFTISLKARFNKDNNSNQFAFGTDQAIAASIFAGSAYSSNASFLSDTTWAASVVVNPTPAALHTYVAVNRSATDRSIYLDGVKGSTTTSGTPTAEITKFYVGGWTNGGQLNGTVRDVKIFQTALSDSQVASL